MVPSGIASVQPSRACHAVACPITVEDHLWGAMSLWFRDSGPPPVDTEECIREFVAMTDMEEPISAEGQGVSVLATALQRSTARCGSPALSEKAHRC